VASYTCHCPPAGATPSAGTLPWGGDRCHVELHGCTEHRCENGAACLPWLRGGEHGHACLCPHGFHGDRCATPTTFSFSTAAGFVHVEVGAREEEEEDQDRHRRRREVVDDDGNDGWPGYGGVRLRFRTKLPDMLLFYRGDATNFLSLEIVGGGLLARALLAGTELDVRYPGSVSDGDWWDAHASLTEDDGGGLILVVKGAGCDAEGCTIVDPGDRSGFRLNRESFAHVYVGGAPDALLRRTASRTGFLGCMEDLEVDSRPVLPQDLSEDHGHELGCNKTEWCESDPCSGHGRCVDLWTSYRCDCSRPYRSHNCSEGKHFPQNVPSKYMCVCVHNQCTQGKPAINTPTLKER